MSEFFTAVEIEFHPDYLNYWLRFGAPMRQVDLDRRRSISFFPPCSVFGYVRWCANEYGTRDWRFHVIQSLAPHRILSCVEGVHPGGDQLLLAVGKAKVKRVLSLIDRLESDGHDPIEVSPTYYRRIHNCLATNHDFGSYLGSQHIAYQSARRVFL